MVYGVRGCVQVPRYARVWVRNNSIRDSWLDGPRANIRDAMRKTTLWNNRHKRNVLTANTTT